MEGSGVTGYQLAAGVNRLASGRDHYKEAGTSDALIFPALRRWSSLLFAFPPLFEPEGEHHARLELGTTFVALGRVGRS